MPMNTKCLQNNISPKIIIDMIIFFRFPIISLPIALSFTSTVGSHFIIKNITYVFVVTKNKYISYNLFFRVISKVDILEVKEC